MAFYFLCMFIYDLILEISFKGQTFGKMIMKTRVIKTDGTPATVGSYFIRWALGILELYATLGSIAAVSIVSDSMGRRLGDKAAGTTVAKIGKKIDIEDMIFEETDDDYEPQFPSAVLLNDSDIYLLKDLQAAYSKDNAPENIVSLIVMTKEKIEQKIGVRSDMGSVEFIGRIISDYNHIHGKNA
jgi:hypothetical protein